MRAGGVDTTYVRAGQGRPVLLMLHGTPATIAHSAPFRRLACPQGGKEAQPAAGPHAPRKAHVRDQFAGPAHGGMPVTAQRVGRPGRPERELVKEGRQRLSRRGGGRLAHRDLKRRGTGGIHHVALTGGCVFIIIHAHEARIFHPERQSTCPLQPARSTTSF